MIIGAPQDVAGKFILELRAHAAVTAIAAARTYGRDRPEGMVLPAVLVDDGGSVPYNGQHQSGLRVYTMICRAIGPHPKDSATGDITARQLAHAIVAAVGYRGPRRAGSVLTYQSTEASVGPDLTDPDGGEPYVPVTVRLIVAASAVA